MGGAEGRHGLTTTARRGRGKDVASQRFMVPLYMAHVGPSTLTSRDGLRCADAMLSRHRSSIDTRAFEVDRAAPDMCSPDGLTPEFRRRSFKSFCRDAVLES